MIFEPGFDAFRETWSAGRPQILVARLVDDLETPVSAFLKIGRGRPYSGLFESVEGGAWRGRYSVITLEPDLVWRAYGARAEIARGASSAAAFVPEPDDAISSLRRLVEASRIAPQEGLPPMAAGLFGVLGYDMVRLVEPLGAAPPDPLGLPDAVLTRPSVVAVFDSVGGEILLCAPVRPGEAEDAETAYRVASDRLRRVASELERPVPPIRASAPEAPVELVPGRTREEYRNIVRRARRYIEAGDIFQVVPSHRFSRPFRHEGLSLYRSLRRLNPSPFLFYLELGGFELVGSSPEILVRLRDGKVTIRPIAGTRRRGATPAEDAALEAELLADPKERAEHLMLLDLGRNDVGRTVSLLDERLVPPLGRTRVRVTESFVVERYSHVMHIVSNVEGDAPEGLDPVDVILTALPAGTLSGAPKVRAMQIIDEFETVKRGVAYGGAAGYISSNGSVDTCIVLRTALLKDGMLHVQAGGGIVADSDPDAEYDETLQKSRAVRRAAEEAWRFGPGNGPPDGQEDD